MLDGNVDRNRRSTRGDRLFFFMGQYAKRRLVPRTFVRVGRWTLPKLGMGGVGFSRKCGSF